MEHLSDDYHRLIELGSTRNRFLTEHSTSGKEKHCLIFNQINTTVSTKDLSAMRRQKVSMI